MILQPFLVTGGVIPPVVFFRLYGAYLKNSNGATNVIQGVKFSCVVGNYNSVQLNRKLSTISGLITILKFVCCYWQYEINDVVITHVKQAKHYTRLSGLVIETRPVEDYLQEDLINS